MNRPLKGAVIVGVFCAGSVSGHLFTDRSPSQPETVTVQEPSVSPSPVPSPYPSPVPLPESCLAALDTLGQTEAFVAVVTKSTGKHGLNMTQAGVAMTDQQLQKLNRIIQREIHLKAITDEAAVQLAQLQMTLDRETTSCRADIEDGS